MAETPSLRPGFVDYGLLCLLAALWGASFMLLKIAVTEIPPVTVTAARQGIALATFVIISLVSGQRLLASRSDHLTIILVAFFGFALPFTLITWGVEEITAGLAAILMGAMPLTTIVLAHFATHDEKMNVAKIVGVLFGIAGLMVLFWPDVVQQTDGHIWRQLAVIGAALSYGVNAVLTKRLLHLQAGPMFARVVAWSFALLVLAALLVEPLPTDLPSPPVWIAILLLGVFPSGIATLLMFRIIARQGATFFGQINLLVPAAGVLWAALILGERLPAQSLVAMAIIILGVAVARLGTGKRVLSIGERTS